MNNTASYVFHQRFSDVWLNNNSICSYAWAELFAFLSLEIEIYKRLLDEYPRVTDGFYRGTNRGKILS